MTVALRSPSLLRALIPVDNAPVDANLKSDFHKYVRGLREIEDKRPQKQVEADAILQEYEKASWSSARWREAQLICQQNLAIRQFLLTNLIRSQDGGGLHLRIPIKILAAGLDNMGDFPYKDSSGARFDGSTLVIRGSKSHYVADDVLPVIGQFFPRFILKDIDSGHWVISEQPEAFRQGKIILHVFAMRNSLTTKSCCRIYAACGPTGHVSLMI